MSKGLAATLGLEERNSVIISVLATSGYLKTPYTISVQRAPEKLAGSTAAARLRSFFVRVYVPHKPMDCD
ncbi:MAG: hypothetical protein VYA08_01475 [Pseudomonadota bacterium]|nr:hypothetical protein [Pseudomonadota bacterium]